MAAVSLSVDDLSPFADIDEEKGQALIDDVLALAARVAPCIETEDFAYDAAARAVLRGVVLRWYDAGSGAVTQMTAGPFGQTIQQATPGARFRPDEISALQELCRDGDLTGQAYQIDTLTSGLTTLVHADICALFFGALYCSCGAVLTQNLPLYENLP